MKICSRCKKEKLLSEFYKKRSNPTGLMYICKSCKDIENAVYRNRHKKAISIRNKKWWAENPEKAKVSLKKSRAKRLANKPHTRLLENMRSALNYTLKNIKKPRRTWDIFDFTLEELKTHLESQFVDGMIWENYGKWHVDHIIAIDFFEFDSVNDVEFKMCWRLDNLQPLWAADNLSKSNKIIAA